MAILVVRVALVVLTTHRGVPHGSPGIAPGAGSHCLDITGRFCLVILCARLLVVLITLVILVVLCARLLVVLITLVILVTLGYILRVVVGPGYIPRTACWSVRVVCRHGYFLGYTFSIKWEGIVPFVVSKK